MSRVNPTPAQRTFNEGRLMQVLVAPIVSENIASNCSRSSGGSARKMCVWARSASVGKISGSSARAARSASPRSAPS